ncbi:MAG: periplasmic heavy metal sensor [Henriciella sp.]|nr:periplasmic heavy metal sensor [Henriciella sp.]
MTEQMRSKLPYGLVVSLIINALLIGLFIGGGLANRGGEDRRPPPDMPSEVQLLRGLESRLSNPERRILRTAIRKSLTEGEGSHARMREARANLNGLLARNDVSAEEIEQALEAIREIDAARRTALHTEIANQLSQLSVEERREILEAMAQRRRFGERRHRRDPPPGDRPPPPR